MALGAGPHGAFPRLCIALDSNDAHVRQKRLGIRPTRRALYHRGDYEAAAGAWLRAWELRPSTAKHLNNAAVAAMALGKHQMAFDLLTRVLTLEPGNAKALSNIRIIREATRIPSRDERIRTRRLDRVESKKALTT